MKIVVSEEELYNSGLLPLINHWASLVGFIDRRAGFITGLNGYSYSPLTFNYTFEVYRYKD